MEPVIIFLTRPVYSKSTPIDRSLTGPVDRFFYWRFMFRVQYTYWQTVGFTTFVTGCIELVKFHLINKVFEWK